MSCEMHALVMARRDGRLGDKDRASVERHLTGCAACRALVDDLSQLAALGERAGEVPALAPLEHRRRRLAVLRAAASPRAKEASTTWSSPTPWAVALAAIAALAIAWLTFGGRDVRTAQTPPPRASMVTAARATIAAAVSEAPSARFDRQTSHSQDGELERVRLYEGTVDVQVDALLDGQRFIVATGDAEVEVRGTRFSVHAQGDLLVEVIVQEGLVEVRQGTATTMVAAGESWVSPTKQALASEVDPALPTRAPHAVAVVQSEGDGDPYATDGADPDATADSVGAPRDEPSDETDGSKERKPRARSAASRDFAAAMGKLEQGDYSGATTALRGFAKSHATDARSEDADFLTIIALQRGGRHAAAAQAARHYLAKYPRGARRAEARTIADRTGQ